MWARAPRSCHREPGGDGRSRLSGGAALRYFWDWQFLSSHARPDSRGWLSPRGLWRSPKSTSVDARAYICGCSSPVEFSSIHFKFPMSRSDPTGALLLGTGVGVWIFFKGFRVFREFKIVADTPCMPIRSVPMGLVQVRGQALTDQPIPSPLTHTPCCFYQVKIEHYETGEHGGWKHYRTDMDGAKFYLQDQTGKVLVDSHSAEYDLPEGPPRVVDGGNIAPVMGTGASDQELLQYVQRAGVNQLASHVEHWLDKKGPLEDPRHEQGRQALLEIARAIPQAMTGQATLQGRVPAALVERIMASQPLADPKKEEQRQKFLQQIRETGTVPSTMSVSTSSATGRYRLRESLILPGQEYHVTGTCVENPDARDAHDRNMIVLGQNEKTFLISWKPEQEVRHGLRNRALGMVFGGAALALFCLALLLWHLNLY